MPTLFDPETIDREISPDDGMLVPGGEGHYFSAGASALDGILYALSIMKKEPGSILDFGCGAGRVTRWLHHRFPDAQIEACDIREQDIAFVAERFGAKTFKSGTVVEELEAPSTYDLIWVGSVFTHLPADASLKLLDKLASWLNPGGVLVFTSHGEKPSTEGEARHFYGIPESWEQVKVDYHQSGFGYADYSYMPGYGISLTKLSWWAARIEERPLRIISMTAHAWDDHQDVIAVQTKM